MRNKLLPLLMLILSAGAYGQKLPDNFSSKYDKFKDITTVMRKTSIIKSSNRSTDGIGGLLFIAAMRHPGKTLTVDAKEFAFQFSSISMFCRLCLYRSHGLIIMADETRLDLGDGDWSGSSNGEAVFYQIDRKHIETLAAAKNIEFQIGKFEGKFADNDRETVKTLLDLGTLKK